MEVELVSKKESELTGLENSQPVDTINKRVFRRDC
jgi:hypothetical protein